MRWPKLLGFWTRPLFSIAGRRARRTKGVAAWRRKSLFELLEERRVLATMASGGNEQLVAAYGQLPLSFEGNQGQTDAQVQYLSRGSGYALFLTSTGATLSLIAPTANATEPASAVGATGVSLAMNLVGSNPSAVVAGLDEQAGTSNYFVGSDPSQWHSNIANYGKVEYQDVYPGVNLVYYGNQRQLEYDFVVAPWADPGSIRFKVDGADSVSLDDQGNLVLHTASGDVLQHAPVIYQQVGGVRQSVAGQFVLSGSNEVGFQVGSYDPSMSLTIDPVLSYSGYLGGNGFDILQSIAVDTSGNAYIAGRIPSTNFPTTAGAFRTSHVSDGGLEDAVVTKLNASGTALVYSTYLGGNSADEGLGIAVDSSGNAYVAGTTSSTDFPTTAGAFQTSNPNVAYFVTKLNASGTALTYSTYLGDRGSNVFGTYAPIVVDSSGNAYVTAHTSSTTFPTTAGAFRTSHASDSGAFDAFVTKLNTTGTALVYSTYLGGNGNDIGQGIALDSSNNAYITGLTASTNFSTTAGAFQTSHASDSGSYDGFVTKLNTTGTALVYSTYLGGNDYDASNGIALDSSGNVYVAGATVSTNFPTTAGAFQTSNHASGNAFVTKLNTAGTALSYSTYLGGNNIDRALGIAVNSSGNAYVAGSAASFDFPITADAFQTTHASDGGSTDIFVTKLNTTGTALVYSTFLGGTGGDGANAVALAIDSAGNAYVTGDTFSTNFPTTAGAFQTTHASDGSSDDGFVARFSFATYAESLSGGVLSITQLDTTANDSLSFSLSGGNYTITDANGLKFDTPTGSGAGSISGGGTSTITIPSASVSSISVALGNGINLFTFTGSGGASVAPITVNTGTTAGSQINITGAVLDSGAVSLTSGSGGITANASGSLFTTGATVTLNTTGPIGTSSNRIQFADNTNTAQQNVVIGSTNQPSSVFLDGLGSLTLGVGSPGTELEFAL